MAAGALGGALALGGASLVGDFGTTTTVREVAAPLPSPISLNEPAAARAGALSVNAIYRHAAPGVVQVTATQVVSTPSVDPFGFAFPAQQKSKALGSGFVIDKAGHIVTNYHVVEHARLGRRQLLEQREPEGEGRRRRPVHRHRGAAGRRARTGADAAGARQLGRRPRRRRGGRDRQPVRLRPHRHGRDRQRAAARDPRAEQLLDRPRDPDRRRPEQGQLGRPAARRARQRDRRQLADRGRATRARAATSGSASRFRSTRSRRSPRRSSRRDTRSTRTSASRFRRSRRARPSSSTCPRRTACSSPASSPAAGPPRPACARGRATRRSPARRTRSAAT